MTKSTTVSQFIKAWWQELPGKYQAQNRWLRFGIRNRLVLFMSALIVLAYGIAWYSNWTTVCYVVDRELVDLKDESMNSRLELQLALEETHALVKQRIRANQEKAENEDSVVKLAVRPLSELKEIALLRDYHFEKDTLEAELNADADIWSSIYWKDNSAFINLIFVGENHAKYLAEIDLTATLSQLTRPTRAVTFLVNSDGSMGMGPNGNSASPLPTQDISAAIEHFRNSRAGNILVEREGVQFPPDFSRSEPGFSPSSLLGEQVSLLHTQTKNLPTEVFLSLSNDVLKSMEFQLRESDPYVRVSTVNPQVGALRIRASSENSLQLVQLRIQMLIDLKASSHIKVAWNVPVQMDEFILRVQGIKRPGSGPNGDFIAFLVTSASITEIENAANDGLKSLNLLSACAALLALVLTWLAASYLARPLTRMQTIAEKISEIGPEPSQQNEEQVRGLLSQLPVGRSDEVGTLAEKFRQATLDLIDTNKQLRLSKEQSLAEQHKTELIERGKAVADKVSVARARLLASVSHDMRQPLHLIMGELESQLDRVDRGLDQLSPDQVASISIIQRSANELSYLIADILDYQRIEAGSISVEHDRVNVGSMLIDLVSHFSGDAQERGNQLLVKNNFNGTLLADAFKLKRVLRNLVSNSNKATKKGCIQLHANPVGAEMIEFAIQDSGVGMSDLQQQLVFQPSDERARLEQMQSSDAKKDAESTGLGLYICKQLIVAMGGDIRFVSEFGSGTTFFVTLPVAARQANAARSSVNDDDRHLEFSNSQPTALIVDDDPKCRSLLAKMLQGMGYTTVQAESGEEALAVVAQMVPEIITLDVFMPGMDGWETLERLKSDPTTEDIAVIMITVDPNQERATVLGADGFVAKPVKRNALTTSIRRAIGTPERAKILVVDDDANCRRQLKRLIEPFGWSVIEAADGEEALERISQLGNETLDMAIVDLFMPNMDGFELIDRMSQMSELRDTPIIVLSAGMLTAEQRNNLLPHVSQFFGKGSVNFDMLRREITRQIEKFSGRRSQATSNPKTFIRA
jgi:CheY-like chemotaxis protein